MWLSDVNRINGRNGQGRNKLRLYRKFKQEFCTESYCYKVINRNYRGALAKFRSGTAPIRIEIGRYINVPIENRICNYCESIGVNIVEDERHVLLECPLYNDLRPVV